MYVIISNVLTLMLNKATERREIGYHPRCKEVKLSHLSFADDIMVFTDGSPQSLRGTIQVFEEFAKISGLSINLAKSTLYAGGRGRSIIEQEATALGLSVSALPAKYLGLPLTTKTLTRKDYEPLVENIKSRLQSWTSKYLYFAGRLQLIQSVIYSTSNFWSSAFCLQKGCLNEIESLCSSFLWSGSPCCHGKTKVSWEDVCTPKEEGGGGGWGSEDWQTSPRFLRLNSFENSLPRRGLFGWFG